MSGLLEVDLHVLIYIQLKTAYTWFYSYIFIALYQIQCCLVYRLEHIKLQEQHKGHESMHAEMVLILLVTLVVAQIVLVEWKKRHYRSYMVCRKEI